MTPPSEGPLICLLVRRLAMLFFIMCLLTGFLYAAGTRQEFMDRTQLLLLRLMLGLGVFLIPLSSGGLVLDLWLVFRRGMRRYVWGAGAYVFLGLFGSAAAFFGAFITAAAGGNLG